MNKKISSLAGIAILVVVAAIVALVLVYQNWTPKPVAQNTPTPIPAQSVTPTPSQSGTPTVAITPTPTPTIAGWQIYKDLDFGIEFQYPGDLARVTKTNSNEIKIWFGKWGVGGGVGDLVIKKARSYQERVDFMPDQNNPNTKLLVDFNFVLPTDNQSDHNLDVFAWRTPNSLGGGNSILIVTKIHQITFNDFMFDDADVKKTLKSIKWILPDKIYRNQNLGFEFEYPGDSFLNEGNNKVEVENIGWEASPLYLSVEKTNKTLQQFIEDYNRENNAYAQQSPAIKEYKIISFPGADEAYHIAVDRIMMCCGDNVYYIKKGSHVYLIESHQLGNKKLEITKFKLIP